MAKVDTSREQAIENLVKARRRKDVSTKSVQKIANALSTALLAVAAFSCPVFAYGESDVMGTLRSPLIYGAPDSPAWMPAQQGAPPAIGDGYFPAPVTGGDYGFPCPPVTSVPMPLVGPMDKGMVNAYAAPYLTPPPSTQGYDPCSINGSRGGYGVNAPVSVVNVCPGGGLKGSAPTRRWQAQRSFDHGQPNNVRGNGSTLNDFGQKLTDKPDLKMTPQVSEDGPRQQGSWMGQTTQDLRGNRSLFKGPNLRSQLTIAPF